MAECSNRRSPPGEVKGGAITPIEVKESAEDMGETLLIGTAEQVVEKLVPYAELGIHDLMLNMSFGGRTATSWIRWPASPTTT